MPLAEKPEPLRLSLASVTLLLFWFAIVTEALTELPACTLPNDTAAGFATTDPVEVDPPDPCKLRLAEYLFAATTALSEPEFVGR